MTFATDMLAVSRELIQEFGEQLTFSRVSEGAYDVSDGSVATGSSSNFQAYSAPMDYSNNELDGQLIQANDVRLLVEPPTSDAPALGDTVVLDSSTLRILDVKKHKVQGTVVLYECQCRQ